MNPAAKENDQEWEREDLGKQVSHMEGEARMVLPGVQAIFGFQLIAVFSKGFPELPYLEKLVHLVALISIVIATLLVLSPAAYHRQVEPDCISTAFVKFASRMLSVSMYFLMTGITLDCYVITRVITGNIIASLVFAILLFIAFIWAWYLFPKREAAKVSHSQ